MRSRRVPSLFVLTIVVALTSSVLGQPSTSGVRAGNGKAARPRAVFRTTWGHPDLQGTWANQTITPLERPAEFYGKEFLTAEEAAALEKQTAERGDADRRDQVGSDADVSRAYNDFWWDRATKVLVTRRTSLIVDPPDGRIPSLTAEAQERAKVEALRPAVRHMSTGGRGTDSWLDRGLWERCIIYAPLPRLPRSYNPNLQIFQTPDLVVISYEMIHEVRIIPLDGRPHLGENLRQWLGDSRGHWDGDTLVVDTTNFSDKTNFRGSAETLHLVERYRRIDEDTLLYEFTVDDPATWTRPWTAQIPMPKSSGQIYEYACHEGNSGLPGILAGARFEEKAAAEEAAKKGAR
jgi:hypothetical protein